MIWINLSDLASFSYTLLFFYSIHPVSNKVFLPSTLVHKSASTVFLRVCPEGESVGEQGGKGARGYKVGGGGVLRSRERGNFTAGLLLRQSG